MATWMSDFGRAVEAARAEADRLRESFAALRGSASSLTASGGSGGGDGGDPLRGLKDLSKGFQDLQKALKSSVTVSKALGLEEASKKLEAISTRIAVIGTAVQGLSAAASVLRVAFVPVVTIVGAVLAALIGVQQVFKETTGFAFTLTETVQVMGLSLAKAFANARAEAIAFFNDPEVQQLGHFLEQMGKDASDLSSDANIANMRADYPEGFFDRPAEGAREVADGLADARAEAEAYQDQINEIAAAAEARGPLSPGGILAEGAALLTGLYEDVAAQLAKILKLSGDINHELTGPNSPLMSLITVGRHKDAQQGSGSIGGDTAIQTGSGSVGDGPPGAVSTPRTESEAEAFGAQLGQTAASSFSTEWHDGTMEGLQSWGQSAHDVIVDALTIDKDGEEIHSFKDFLKNIGDLFTSNPLGFVGGLFSLLGPTGGTGAAARVPGRAEGGIVPDVGGRALPGLASSDTTLLAGTPGEYVTRKAAVQAYGLGLFEALNNLAISPSVVGALLGGRLSTASVVPPPMSSRIRGYASGGVVGGGARGGITVLPVLVTSPRDMEQLTSGQQGSVLRAMGDDPGSYRAALGL